MPKAVKKMAKNSKKRASVSASKKSSATSLKKIKKAY